ncbi:DUF5681 domain-containing protein [Tabrizicola sp. BL-A-41-H6]|uniref:DUF5681 domain-containing protein n=1 Tax=Tabrizicola sp. BL-A-41-H6 TaxID=3421107 RepID=UPI003D671F81
MSEDDDDVGYRRPPKHGQFRKGTSGNPEGRRVEQERFASVLREELATEIVMKIGDKKVKASVLRGLTRLVIQQALSGDSRAITELMRQINRYFPERPTAEDSSLPPSEADLKLLEDYVSRRSSNPTQNPMEGQNGDEF